MRIGIVGAGTAGAAAGTMLARAGHDVTVFERGLDRGLLRRPIPLAELERHLLP